MSDKQKLKTAAIQTQLADLTETMQREKVEITPDVQRCIDENVARINLKLQNDDPVYPSDLVFIAKINVWVECEGGYTLEQIDSGQFKALLKLAKDAEKDINWIKEKFVIKGNKIVHSGSLDLEGCTGLTELPEGLHIDEGYLTLKGCTGLTELPKELNVDGCIYLNGCTGLAELPEGINLEEFLYLDGCTGLTKLPDILNVGGLSLVGCTGLTKLPEGLEVGTWLSLVGCTGLTKLPEGLEIEGGLDLSGNLNEQIHKDAKRLYKAGKINDIRYV